MATFAGGNGTTPTAGSGASGPGGGAMSRPQQVAWFSTKQEAVDFEAKCFAQARANGQVCERWADIIEDKVLGFGVPMKDRIKSCASVAELAKVSGWTPPEVVR